MDRSRVQGTYLENAKIRQLVITKDGCDREFDRLDLRGLNLANANLNHANFMAADLSRSTLEGADLTDANLVRSRLHGVDLSTAILTGAYIQDWGISTDTQFDGVRCKYIYMRSPDARNSYRKPDNENETFADNDFADFIAPIVKTLDLYQQQYSDPRAIGKQFKTLDLYYDRDMEPEAAIVAFQQLAQQYPEAGLEILTLEGRESGRMRVQAKVAGDVNISELNQGYFQFYRQSLAQPQRDRQDLVGIIAEKDKQIYNLLDLLRTTRSESRTFYVETYHNFGGTMSDSKGNVNITTGDDSKISGVAGAGESMTGSALVDISGTVSNTLNQLPETSDPEKPGIKELLVQLKEAIESESSLDDDEKKEALEQIDALGKASQNPKDEKHKKLANRATGFLGVIVAALPATAKLVDAFEKLMPKVMAFFGL